MAGIPVWLWQALGPSPWPAAGRQDASVAQRTPLSIEVCGNSAHCPWCWKNTNVQGVFPNSVGIQRAVG